MMASMRAHTEFVGVVWESGTVSADATSDGFDMRDNNAMAVRVVCTGDLVGPVYLQGSYDNATFVTLTDANGDALVAATLAGAGATFLESFSDVNVPYCALFFDRTSGEGTIVASVAVK